MTTGQPIAVTPLRDIGDGLEHWRSFLRRSQNGTLFHDLDFLAYHPAGRFNFHHLIFTRHDETVALCPGGFADTGANSVFCSPLGASIGGFVLSPEVGAELVLGIVEALQTHARLNSWSEVNITLPPNYYDRATSGYVEFALFTLGFRIKRRWLTHAIFQPGTPGAQHFRKRQSGAVRVAHKKGMQAIEGGAGLLSDFLVPFRDTYFRHGVAATHSEDELRDLLERFPKRARIHIATLNGEPTAGLFVLYLTNHVANTFYICRTEHLSKENGAAFLVADLVSKASAGDIRAIDLGPSANDQRFNKGVTFFKEGLGASGQCRDLWQWSVRRD